MRTDKLITFYTPTFNREKFLKPLYESLCNQKNGNFVWLIIDDGSADGTGALVEQWQREGKIEIEYHYKENGGIHTAKNEAQKYADTPLTMYVPSDCEFMEDAVEKIERAYRDITEKEDFSGFYDMVFHYADKETGERVGEPFPMGVEKCTYCEYQYKYRIKADKIGVLDTARWKMAHYPVHPGEKLYPDNHLDYFHLDEYQYFVDECLMYLQYTTDGYTKNLIKTMSKAPNGYYEFNVLRLQHDSDVRQNIKSTIHMIGFGRLAGRKVSLSVTPHKFLYLLCRLPGELWYRVLKSERNGDGIATKLHQRRSKIDFKS